MRIRPEPTELQFDRWLDALSAWVSESVSPFSDKNATSKERRIARAGNDPLFFCKTYLPHYFDTEFAQYHFGSADRLQLKNEFILEVEPRGHAKTTRWCLGFPLWNTCFKKRLFNVYISETSDLSQVIVSSLRIEIECNVRIKNDFGSLIGHPWRDDNFVTSNGVRHFARSYKKKVRGIKHHNVRPDFIVIDDFDSNESVRNKKITSEKKEWVKGEVLGSVGENWLCVYVGNIFSRKCVLNQLMKEEKENCEPKYRTSFHKAWVERVDGTRVPLWPSRWPAKRLREMAYYMGEKAFRREFMHEDDDDEGEFPRDKATYYEIPPSGLITASFCDPSVKAGENSDYRAVITVGLHVATMKYYVLDAWIKRKKISSMFSHCYKMESDYNCIAVGIEQNMLGDFLHETIEFYAKEYGRHIKWRPVDHRSNKFDRIVGSLSRLYNIGSLLFKRNNSDQNLLIDQLCNLADGSVNDDGPDALGACIDLLSKVSGSRIGSVSINVPARHNVRRWGAV